MYTLTVDFGSTFTKLTAIDRSARKILGTARAFTTIETDIRDGFNAAKRELDAALGTLEYDERFAASSAGGGLKMVAVGLVPDLTAKAARLAANNAGAKVIKTFAYDLSAAEQDEIYEINPDIVLLCGGTDGGNREVILRNAARLADIDRAFSVVVAGNKSAADAVMNTFKGKKDTILAGNVMPSFGELNIMPAKAAIRDVFIRLIIVAKGITPAQKMMTGQIIPTPLAVFEAAELLSRGAGGLPDLMVVDVGGATTDVYSMADGAPTRVNAVLKGLTEPYAKRSVEGDLGLRYGMPSLIEAANGAERVAAECAAFAGGAGVTGDSVREWLEATRRDPGLVPGLGSAQKAVDDALAAMAVQIAFERHCGILESAYTPLGETFLQSGKDLTGVRHVVGVGGPVINSTDFRKVLEYSVAGRGNPMILKPAAPKLMLDRKYIFAAMGLLGRSHPELAVEIMQNEIV